MVGSCGEVICLGMRGQRDYPEKEEDSGLVLNENTSHESFGDGLVVLSNVDYSFLHCHVGVVSSLHELQCTNFSNGALSIITKSTTSNLHTE